MICEKCGHNNGKKSSTNQQRKAYFGIGVKRLAEHYSREPQIMHKALAMAFFGTEEVKIGDQIYKVPATTTGRTTKEFNEFFEYIQKIGSEIGVNIPSPNEVPMSAYK